MKEVRLAGRRLFPCAAILLAGCGGGSSEEVREPNTAPEFLKGSIVSATYDGVSHDLLTGGLGKSGLAGSEPPLVYPVWRCCGPPSRPTVDSIRRQAIYTSYGAHVDVSPNGGYGTLFGPNVDASGNAGAGEGRIAGEEHMVLADAGNGTDNVTLMVQVPQTFRPEEPCIVVAASSGSRGIYGAMSPAGEWALKRGCAAAYTDKGTGVGAHDIQAHHVIGMQGWYASLGHRDLDGRHTFFAKMSGIQEQAYNQAFPGRWALKHAHSQINPEKDWGRDVLRATQFAFYVLNRKYGTREGDQTYRHPRLAPGRTLVIAAGFASGGAAALAAAEADTENVIKGVVAAAPMVSPDTRATIAIRRGGRPVSAFAKPVFEFLAFANVFQPCAAISSEAGGVADATLAARAANRCAAMLAHLGNAAPGARGSVAMSRLLASGWEPESSPSHAAYFATGITAAAAITYANAYTRASVLDNLCGFSLGMAPLDGSPAYAAVDSLFSRSSGMPSSGGLRILNNNSRGGAAVDTDSINPASGLADLNPAGALCLQGLLFSSTVLKESMQAVKRSGNLRGKPAIIVHGRADAMAPVNHTSRAYYALNKAVEGGSSRLAYYEVANAQHLDGDLGSAGNDTRHVPLLPYFNRALDLVHANLREGAPIPASQVVRAVPRGGSPGAAPALTPAHVKPIVSNAATADGIAFANDTLDIPD